jgi:hypothetical protein
MRVIVILLAFVCSAFGAGWVDDDTSARLLLGTWRGDHHQAQYRADGTCTTDRPESGSRATGRWHIRDRHLITTWRSEGASTDSTVDDAIIELIPQLFRFRTIYQEGPGRPKHILPSDIYAVHRVSDGK